MKKKILAIFILSILISLTNVNIIQADIAPPLQPPGAVLGPAEFVETDIEMAMESVTIYVEEAGKLYYAARHTDTVNGRVTATFAMANPGANEVTLDVVFPLTNMDGYGDGHFNFPEIHQLVDKKQKPHGVLSH